MNLPVVTIGIPCFNSERWLAEAVQSAIRQTWRHCEVIVVDDGSTDGSREILERFGDQIQLVAGEHRGANHARNEVLRRARGEWMQYLDADDYLLPQKIEHQLLEAGGGFEADVLYSAVIIDENHTRTQSRLNRALDLYAQWLSWQLPQTGGVLWRREALERIGGWNEAMPCCQEHELYLRALKAELRFQPTDIAHAVYRIWSDGTLCRRDPNLVVEIKTKLIDDLRAWMTAEELWLPVHTAIAGQACFEMGRTLARTDPALAARYHRERQKAGLWQLAGEAAPLRYKLVHRLLGFASAEKLARTLR